MKCRVCGTEIREQIYCPMCGAAIKKEQENEKEQQEVLQIEQLHRNQGIDVSATTVLAVNNMTNGTDEKKHIEEKGVVLGEEEKSSQSLKKQIFVLSIMAGILFIAGAGIFYYFQHI